jgi:hypothetical protein
MTTEIYDPEEECRNDMTEDRIREIIREEIGTLLNAMLDQAYWQATELKDGSAMSLRDTLVAMDYEIPPSDFEDELPF